MLESMFRDKPKVDTEELDLDTIKEMLTEAHKTKEEAANREGRPAVVDKTIVISKLPIAPEFGIDLDYLPELVNIHEWSKSKGKKVDKLYYQCKVCQHEAQNRASILAHTNKCLKIFCNVRFVENCIRGLSIKKDTSKRSMNVRLQLVDQVQLLWQQSNLSFLSG